MSDFNRLKDVDHNTKSLINGYIRQTGKEFSLLIPELISIICILYYYHFERFTLHGNQIKANESGTVATALRAATGTNWIYNTIYGNIAIKHPRALKLLFRQVI